MPGQKDAFGIVLNTGCVWGKAPPRAVGMPLSVQFGELEQILRVLCRSESKERIIWVF